MICRVEFGLFTRRHHCRACGRVLCDACSPVRADGVGRQRALAGQRVCPPCCATIAVAEKQALAAAMAAQSSAAEAEITASAASQAAAEDHVAPDNGPTSLIYETYSACARCAIIDRKGTLTCHLSDSPAYCIHSQIPPIVSWRLLQNRNTPDDSALHSFANTHSCLVAPFTPPKTRNDSVRWRNKLQVSRPTSVCPPRSSSRAAACGCATRAPRTAR